MRRVIAIAVVVATSALSAGCGGGPIVSSLHVEAPLERGRARPQGAARDGHVSERRVGGGWPGDRGAHRAEARRHRLFLDGGRRRPRGGRPRPISSSASRSTELVAVTARERQGRGDGAGQMKIVASVRLVDKASGAELGKASVTAAGYTGPRGGTTEDAEDEVARRVIELMSGKHRRRLNVAIRARGPSCSATCESASARREVLRGVSLDARGRRGPRARRRERRRQEHAREDRLRRARRLRGHAARSTARRGASPILARRGAPASRRSIKSSRSSAR